MRKLLLSGAAICALLITGLVVSALPGVAVAGPKKKKDDGARDLLLMCQGRYEDPELGLAMCTAYLKGYLDRAHYNHAEGGGVEFCSETGRISPQEAAQALTGFAFTDPNAIDEPMPVFMSLALQKAFPCTEEMAAKILEEENKPPPEPKPFVPKGPAGAVGTAKAHMAMSEEEDAPPPPPPAPMPDRAAGPVVPAGAVPMHGKMSTNYQGPKAGPAGGVGPAGVPRALDGSMAPAAAPGARNAAMTSGGVTRDATPPEIVVRPSAAPVSSEQKAIGKPMSLSGAAPEQPAVPKQRLVGMPPAMTAATGAATPRIKPPSTMADPTNVPTNGQKAEPLPPNTKPYGPVNADGTPAPKRSE